jgi:hypothetical protein
MEDAGRKGAAAAENGIEREGYVVFKAAATDWEGDLAADGGDRGDLAAPAEDAAPAGSEDARPNGDGKRGRGAAMVSSVPRPVAACLCPPRATSAFFSRLPFFPLSLWGDRFV